MVSEPYNPRSIRMVGEQVHYASTEVQELRELVVGLTRDLTAMKEVVDKIQESVGLLVQQKRKDGAHEHEETSEVNADMEKEVGRYRKLELPVFTGEDPLGWFCRAERYFHINAIPETERLEAAIVCLEGKALNLYQWVESRTTIRGWQEFKREVLRRFHPLSLGMCTRCYMQQNRITQFWNLWRNSNDYPLL